MGHQRLVAQAGRVIQKRILLPATKILPAAKGMDYHGEISQRLAQSGRMQLVSAAIAPAIYRNKCRSVTGIGNIHPAGCSANHSMVILPSVICVLLPIYIICKFLCRPVHSIVKPLDPRPRNIPPNPMGVKFRGIICCLNAFPFSKKKGTHNSYEQSNPQKNVLHKVPPYLFCLALPLYDTAKHMCHLTLLVIYIVAC